MRVGDIAGAAGGVLGLRVLPDVLCLQEVEREVPSSSGGSGQDQAALMASSLGYPYQAFAEHFPLGSGSYGLAVLAKEAPVSYEEFDLPFSDSEDSRVTGLKGQYLEWEGYAVANVHVSYFTGLPGSKSDTFRALFSALDGIVSRRASGKPLFVLGDFNCQMSESHWQVLTSRLTCLSDPSSHTAVEYPDKTAADHVFVMSETGQGVVAESSVVGSSRASDHYPVLVAASLPEPEEPEPCIYMNDIMLDQSSEFDSEMVLDPKVNDKAIYEKESFLLYDVKNYVKTDIKTYAEGLAFACLDKLYKTAPPFRYNALENNKLVQYKIPYYDNIGYSVQNLLFTFKAGAYDSSEGEAFRGIVDGATKRHSAVFLYFRDDTQSVNAYARMFEWYQVEGLGLAHFSGLLMGFDNQVLPLAFVLKWDAKKNTYASKSTKTAYDAYRFFLEKSGFSGSRLGQPLYMFYAKLSDGSEVVDWGDFEPATVKSDATFVREMKAKDVYFYCNYFARLGIAFRKRFNTARAELVRSLPDGKSGFWPNMKMRIDKAPDMLEELRTGTFYAVDQAYIEAVIRLSERTGVPVVLRKSVNNIKTDDMPNNIEQIKWQPSASNKLSECIESVEAFVNKCVFGPYAASMSGGTASAVDSKTVDSNNNLIRYLPECGCVLADVTCDIPYDMLDLDSQTERKKILRGYNQLFYVCYGGKCVAATDLLSVLTSSGMTLSFNYRYLKDQVPYVKYLDSITYSGGNVTYNNVEGGTTWWYNNIDRIRDAFVSWFMENIPPRPDQETFTLSFDANGGTGYILPITVTA